MAKFIAREKKMDDDPFSATERTLKFSREPNNVYSTEFDGLDEENEKLDSKGSSSDDLDTKPEIPDKQDFAKTKDYSLNSFTNPIKHRKKINSIKRNIEKEKSECRDIHSKINIQTKRVEEARRSLHESQKKLQSIIEEQSQDYEIVERFSHLGEISAKMAHDIRNPLTVLKAHVDLMRLRYSKNEDLIMLKSLESMEKAVQSIVGQVNDVLGFLKDNPPEISKHDVLELIKKAIADLVIQPTVTIELPKNSCTVLCDETKTISIFSNIVLNAIQAIGEEGEIKIFVTEVDKQCFVDIQDSGPGIPESDLENIFEALYTTKENGTGLGLSRCKQVLNNQGGSISVKNNPTTFSIGFKIAYFNKNKITSNSQN
ncbi:MAG: sensor histidine kinase [Crenarchaeota archaeon]|nr:MAG: sensor histidine kinase [Thermoproteota archaeon]RDJ33998.1 MAG: sensor histidine kinase [Thermoproteota archaeon]RDJ36887.1 MAG: sensor histidine kinase [Thermoproteota archaeon]RDJ37577.1 MAG: sensor histidine kinase [Thermoproteota archaeon]